MNKKRAKEVLLELEARFLDGERLSVEQIIKEYFKITNAFSYLIAKQTTRRFLATLKKRIAGGDDPLWFGCLNDAGEYGICDSEGEYKYAMTRYFAFIKGNVNRAVQLKNEAVHKGLLLQGWKDTPFLLPAPAEERKRR